MPTIVIRLIWLISASFVILLLAQPVSTTVQLEMSIGAIIAMALIWWLSKGRTAHYIFLAIASLVVWRYIYWRVTSTLPVPSDWLNFSAAMLLLGAELYCFYILLTSLIVNADPLTREPPEAQADANLPTVDVFVPSYNEDPAILAVTLAAARSMSYPAEKLTVWLLDDGGTEQKCADPDVVKAETARTRRAILQKLCEELGVNYLARRINVNAKAGNLNNGLRHSSGDIVVVFDADHVPFRSFLRETIGYFAQDPRLFLVQTPHAFVNPDPVERNLRTFEKMPAENEMFYAVNQPGLDKWNASFFCGSAALLRRAALEEAGGFSGITVTEDCETALDIHARGWTSFYLGKTLVAGLQPDTLAAFIGQRSRWCQGMLQIMMFRNPLFKRGLTLIQRICYLSNITFWLFPIPRLIFVLAPLLYIFFDMKIVVANVDEAIAYTATYIVINLMLQNYLYGRFRWPFISELYEYIQSVFLIRSSLAVALSPRKPKFNVTAKNIVLDRDHLSSLAFPYFLIYGILFIGAAVSIYRYFFEPGITNLMLVVGVWNFFNLMTAGAALGVVAERRSNEQVPSIAVKRRGVLRINGLAIDVFIDRVSAEKCRIMMEALPPLRRGDDIDEGVLSVVPLENSGAKPSVYPALSVRVTNTKPSSDEWICELAFEHSKPRDYFALAELMYADADVMARFQESRRSRKSLLSGSVQFVWWGLVEPLRAFSYLLSTAKHVPAEQAYEPGLVNLAASRRVLADRSPADGEKVSIGPIAARARAGQLAEDQPSKRRTLAGGATGWVELMVEAENDAISSGRRRRATDVTTAQEVPS